MRCAGPYFIMCVAAESARHGQNKIFDRNGNAVCRRAADAIVHPIDSAGRFETNMTADARFIIAGDYLGTFKGVGCVKIP